ncbi:hypothetical protein QMZ65_23275 [Pantoea sp. EABMAA-21]|uniref:hypothetical protein n=1 Tax=Pantoea sp. EABMAA-21 TaxID=3043302 RepID=UPI0024B60899|nr:hypothetical protein [Pantoea sp. EABMAA-21]MDI9280144.1 hypothetical protein [Pantoea sp. EABMAA-21]
MDIKDQRLETRITQQEVSDLDDIIASVDTPYKPTRSDLVRSFIAQGIARHYGRSEQKRVKESMPLGQRLGLYFQIQQTYLYQNPGNTPNVLDNGSYNPRSTITESALVRQVYLQRMHWFFSLDRAGLTSVHRSLQSHDVISLMEAEPCGDVCSDLARVVEIRDLFSKITRVLDKARGESNYDDVKKQLAIVDYQQERKGFTLQFSGFPESQPRLTQMAALLQWIDEGDGSRPIWEKHGVSKWDLNAQYDAMLEVYQDITRDRRGLDMNSLITMLEDRRLDFHAA